MAGICAAIQAAFKVRTHRKLRQLHGELDQARQQHVEAVRLEHERQRKLCAQLDLPEPETPAILLPQPETDDAPKGRFRLPVQLPFRKRKALLEQAPAGSSAFIVGRYGASFAASTVWKTSSGAILRFMQPLGARAVTFAPKFASVAPRFATAGGGATGSIAASTGFRFALGAVSIIGLIIGPALAAWSVFNEIRKVKRARQEKATTLEQYRSELDEMVRRTAELEAQLAAQPRPALQLTT